jgi:hypothetical protein
MSRPSWMDDLPWLKEREAAIRERIRLEETGELYDPNGRTPRRDALKVFQDRIAELEARA